VNNLYSALAAFCLLGVVDQVEGRSVTVEISDISGEISHIQMPTWIFPCDVGEGDVFYITKVNDVTEVRCGEPAE